MKIIKLKSENIKRLKVFDITPGPHINRISGANGSGKSSALDSIEWLIAGTSRVASQPVRKGAGKARIVGETEELRITRTFVEGGSRNGLLKMESKSRPGMFHSGPQEILDKLMGPISFDPLEFIRMKAKQQFEVLRRLVKTDVNLDQLQADYQADYLRRREAKKERDQLQIRADGFAVPADLPTKKIDEAALVQELQEASSYNEGISQKQFERNKRRATRQILAEEIETQGQQLEDLEQQLEQLKAEIKNNRALLEKTDHEIGAWPPLPEPKDATALAEQITKARAINQGIDRRTRREDYQKEIDALDTEIETLSASLKAKEETKIATIAAAQFPVPGLAFGEEEVIFEGLPFDQISNADQIRASVAIGMATNPELRVMRIKDGSLLDKASMDVIAQMAQAQDFQVFIEVVDESGKVGVYLEDGEIKAVNEEPEPEQPKPTRTRKKKETTAK